jgi:predicted acetyltransferase
MTVRLVPASSDHQCWIRAELQSYLAELSRFASIEKNAEGQYDYPYLDHYWREPDRHPFVIHLDNEAVGFLLVREDLDPTDGRSLTEIAELYILPAFRQRSVASSAIKEVVSYFPGKWRAAVLPNNDVAYAFWRQLISALDPEFTVAVPASSKNQPFVFSFSA